MLCDLEHSTARNYSAVKMESTVLATLGAGRFSTVTCIKRSDGALYALKRVLLDDIRRLGRTQRILDEKTALQRMQKCPYSIQLLGTEKDAKELRFLLSAELGGSVQQHLRLAGPLTLHSLRIYSAELLSALDYMASNGVMHRDIKASNVLLSADGHLKLCDFGSAKVFPSSSVAYARTLVGTAHAMAPEIVAYGGDIDSDGYGICVDWWSAGCLLQEMATGDVVYSRDSSFPTESDKEAARNVLEEIAATTTCLAVNSNDSDWCTWQMKLQSSNNESSANHDFGALLNQLLEIDPRKRACRLEPLMHSDFFLGVDWDAVFGGRLEPQPFDRRVGFLEIIGGVEDPELTDDQQTLFADF